MGVRGEFGGFVGELGGDEVALGWGERDSSRDFGRWGLGVLMLLKWGFGFGSKEAGDHLLFLLTH